MCSCRYPASSSPISKFANALHRLKRGGPSKREAKFTNKVERADAFTKAEPSIPTSKKEKKSSNAVKSNEQKNEFQVCVNPGIQLMFSSIAYYEIEIDRPTKLEPFDGNCIAIGLARAEFPLTGKQPGWDSCSYGYHGDDGNIFHSSGMGIHYGQPFGPGDVVGCGLDYLTRSIFFTKNGAVLGTAFERIPPGSYYPVVGVDTRAPFTINFGLTKPFVFKHIVYHQQQMERYGLLNVRNYPLHPLLPFLKERVAAGKGRYAKFVKMDVPVEDSQSDSDEDEDWSLSMEADDLEIPGRRRYVLEDEEDATRILQKLMVIWLRELCTGY